MIEEGSGVWPMSVDYPTKLVLAFRNGGTCAFPGCMKPLYSEGSSQSVPIGEAAHIAGERPTAPRYDKEMTDQERNGVSNLIYLCPSCHTLIDKQETQYPVARLKSMKEEHEKKVRDANREALAEVGFAELELVTAHFSANDPSALLYDYSLTSLKDKIRKNELSEECAVTIRMALSIANTVRDFIEVQSKSSPNFANYLRDIFLAEYYSLRNAGYRGDALFDRMCAYAQRGAQSTAAKSAGLAVVAYLFEICEVFEK